ncbi:MAG: helix-turn-helix transcriptional regulator [Bacteroidota bacterium]
MHHVYLVQGLIYTTYTLVLIGRFKRYNLVRWTKVTKSQMFYLKNIFIGLFFVLLIADGAWTFENLRTLIPSLVWLVIPLVNCVLIFSVSIITLNNSNLFYKGIDLKKPSYKSKELPQAEAVKYLEQLRDLMEGNQIYLNPELTLHDISMKLNIQPRQLSKILKIQLNTNFYDYINGFRVKKAKEMIADGKHNEWSLLAIALDSGFNSKSTFNRTFKKSLGCTPSEYISEMMTKKATVMHSRGTKEANA